MSESLPTGHYTIHPAKEHNMYVTGDDFGQALVLCPPGPIYQKWHVIREGETNQYTLKLIEQDGGERAGFSWDQTITPDSRVILKEVREFMISPDGSTEDTYLIRPKRDIIGVDICVGVNDQTRELQFKFFPLHAPPPPGGGQIRPLWCFTRILED